MVLFSSRNLLSRKGVFKAASHSPRLGITIGLWRALSGKRAMSSPFTLWKCNEDARENEPDSFLLLFEIVMFF